ncbi:hypothetical protein [Thioalkalivibrio sp. ALE16]|uniref:hypothetical protein n=1 Tax=Thioalkalivibrio sp. ALE16 TaxID=1158172 RepID=UPI000366FEF4|nr:hypothetical protein [Thioalkalivibrio sp. ALE16]
MGASVQECLAEWQAIPLVGGDEEPKVIPSGKAEESVDPRAADRALRFAQRCQPGIPAHVAPAYMEPV